jgi:hypothetical protein
LAFAAVGVVMGNSLRRPLRGAWDETDLAWSALYALLAGCLAIPYHLWHCRARRQEFDNLALIRGDTLFVFAQPGREQRIPLLGVTRVVQGASGDAGTAITTERAGAMLDADFTLELQADSAARVVEFANACLPPPPEMRMERP